jgi:hypothetical protein
MNTLETRKFEKMLQITNDIEVLAKESKITLLQAQSKILTMAMKGTLSNKRARVLLKGSNASKLLNVPRPKGLSKPLPVANEKIRTVKA